MAVFPTPADGDRGLARDGPLRAEDSRRRRDGRDRAADGAAVREGAVQRQDEPRHLERAPRDDDRRHPLHRSRHRQRAQRSDDGRLPRRAGSARAARCSTSTATAALWGLYFAGGNCLDGDSDAFHFIGYAESTDMMSWTVYNDINHPIASINTITTTNQAGGETVTIPANRRSSRRSRGSPSGCTRRRACRSTRRT